MIPTKCENQQKDISIGLDEHYLGYGAAASGKDRTPAYIAPDDLREKYFRPFKDCMQAGALTMMIDCTETKVWDTPNID